MNALRLTAAVFGASLLAFPASAEQVVHVAGRGKFHAEAVEVTPTGDLVARANGWLVRLPMRSVLAIRVDDGTLTLPPADSAEDRGLRLEAKGDFRQAMEAYGEAAHHALKAAEYGAATWDEAGARIEVYSRRLTYFAANAGASRRAIELYEAMLQRTGPAPYASGVVRTYLAGHLRGAGRVSAAARQDAALGVVTRFFLAGSFDNERGTGFDQAYGPETQPFDPKATFEGKKHPVSWRPLPVKTVPFGRIDLDAIMRPNDQSLAYAITYLHAKQATPVALRVGSDEAIKVWVNGALVHSNKVRRPFRPDQDAVGVTLAQGWNRVLLKVCDETGDWAFRLRVTAPDGSPTSDVRVGSVQEIAAAPKTPEPAAVGVEAPVEAAPVEVSRGAVGVLPSLLAGRPSDWRGRYHLAYLLFSLRANDSTEHPDRDAINEAIAIAPKNGDLRLFLNYTLDEDAEFSVNREDNARRAALEKTLELDPKNHKARLTLATYYADRLGNLDRARALLAPILEAAPEYVDACMLGLRLDRARGLGSLASSRLAALYDVFDQKVAEDEADAIPTRILASLLAEARSADDVRRQIELTEQLLETQRADGGRVASLGELYEDTRQQREAELLLRRAVQLGPFSVNLKLRLSSFYERAGRLDDAARVLREALVLRPDDEDLVERLGHLEDRRGKTEVADALYAKALALNPNAVELQKYLKFRNRGKQASARFEDAWVVDPAPLVAAVAKEPLDPRRTHRILFRQEVARLNSDGTTSEFVQEVLRIENQVGARSFSSYAAVYKTEQHLEFQKAQLFRKAGGVHDAPVGSSRASRAGEFGSRRRYTVRFPPLEPGDVIAVRYRVDDQEEGFFGDYYGKIAYFQGSTRMDWMRYVLIAPEGRELHFHKTPGLKDLQEVTLSQSGATVRVFERKGIPPLESEPNMPWSKEVIPQVQVSTFKDWDAFSHWYWGLVAKQHEADGAIKAKVKELTKDAKTDADKIRAIYNYVVTDIRYNASWEFGIHGFKPYNATKIYARKFGDCKDKATLIGTMLKEVGIEAHPVLIFGEEGRGKEDLTLPLMSHFNHCISWVNHGGEEGLFLDGTAEHHPYKTLPTMDYGANVVVITPEKALVRTIPFRGPEANAIRETHRIKVERGGKATLGTTLEGSGTYGVVLRSVLQSEGRRKSILEPRIGKTFSGARVKSVKTSDLKNLDTPVKVEIEVDLPSVLRKTAAGGFELEAVRSWLFDIIYLGDGKVSGLAADSEREHDVVLKVPSGVEEEVIYELPDDMHVESLPKPVVLEHPFGTYRLEYRREGKAVIVNRVLQIKTHRIPRAQYEAFRKFVQDIERAENERPSLSGKGTEQ